MKNLRMGRGGEKSCVGGAIICKPFFSRGCIKRRWDGKTESVARKRAGSNPSLPAVWLHGRFE